MSLSSPPVIKVPAAVVSEPTIVTVEPTWFTAPSGSVTDGRSTSIVMMPVAAEIKPPAACVKSSPASSVMLPLAETISALALMIRLSMDPATRGSAASRVMSPSAATSSAAVPLSATVMAPSLVITIVPPAAVLTAPCNVPTVSRVSRALPASTLSISILPAVAPLEAASVLISVSSELPLPIPAPAWISSVSAVMLLAAALLSLMAAPASRMMARVTLVTSSSAMLSTSAILIVPEVLLTALSDVPLMSMSAVPSVAPPPIPVAASRSRAAPVIFTFPAPSPLSTSLMDPTLLPRAKSLSSAETVTFPVVLTILKSTFVVASTSMVPLTEEMVTPSAIVTLASALPAWLAPPPLRSSPALTLIAPDPAAEMVPALCRTSCPANRLIFPLPPLAVMLALTVRLSATVFPSAASTMSPPALFTTGLLMVNGLAARTVMSSPLLLSAVSRISTPAMVPSDPIVNPPTLCRLMLPESVWAARSPVTVESISPASPARPLPIPVPARSSAVLARMLIVSAPLPSVIAATASTMTGRPVLVMSSRAILSTSLMLILPEVVLTALTNVPLMSRSPAPSSVPPLPIPVTASRSRVLPVMLAASAAVLSTMAPTELVTSTVLLVVTVLIEIFSLASMSTVPLPALMTAPSAMVRAPWSLPPPSTAPSVSAVTTTLPLVEVMSLVASNVTSLSARTLMLPVVVTTESLTAILELIPLASSSTWPARAETPVWPSTTVIVPPASTLTVPAAASWSSWLMFRSSVSLMSTLPLVVLSRSSVLIWVSIAPNGLPASPTPVTASMVTVPLLATMSVSASPPSTTPAALEVIVTADPVALVVTTLPRVTFSLASMSTVPLPALMTAPSLMRISPVPAAMVTVLARPLISPSAPSNTSSSALIVISALPLTRPLMIVWALAGALGPSSIRMLPAASTWMLVPSEVISTLSRVPPVINRSEPVRVTASVESMAPSVAI